ncbi:MAG: ABC transporter substrate-binding protein [Bacillota bacterium]
MRRKKALLIILSMFLVVSLAAAGCGGGGKKTFKIGYIGPLTGDAALWGNGELNALKLAVANQNKAGGILGSQIEIKYYDNRMDAVETTNAARKLLEQDKVSVIIGTNASGPSIALANMAEQFKVPHIATTSTNPKVTVDNGKVRPFSFRMQYIDPFQGTLMAQYALEKLGAKKAAILYEVGSDYSVGLSQFFKEAFEKGGGTVVANEAYKTGDVDFRAQLTKIKPTQPDVFFVPALYKEIGLIANQSRQMKISATFLGGDTWTVQDIFQLAKESVQGAYYVAPVELSDPKLKPYMEEYKAAYGNYPGGEGANAFLTNDAFLVIMDAVKRANSFDPVKIRDAIEQTKDLPVLTGSFSIDPATHDPLNPEGYILQIEGTGYKLIGKFKAHQ